MKFSTMSVFALAACLLITPAAADLDNRYALSETDAGTIRLDKKTGEVSFCRPANGGVVCTIAADERRALLSNAEEMANRLDELEKRIAHLEATAGSGSFSGGKSPLTSKEEQHLDKAMRVGESFLRRFMNMVKDLEKDLGVK